MWHVDGKINGILLKFLDVWIQEDANFLHPEIAESGDLMRIYTKTGKILWMWEMFTGIPAGQVDLKCMMEQL